MNGRSNELHSSQQVTPKYEIGAYRQMGHSHWFMREAQLVWRVWPQGKENNWIQDVYWLRHMGQLSSDGFKKSLIMCERCFELNENE